MPKYSNGYVYKDVLMLKSDFATGTLLLKHNCLDSTGYFDENLLRHQDYQLLINFTYKYKLYQVDEYLHCCDISDTINRPSGEKLIEHKKKFFNSVSPIINTLTLKEKECVYCIHKFQVGYIFLKEKEYIKALKCFISIIKSPLALKLVLIKIKQRIDMNS